MPVAPDLCGSALDGRYELHSLLGEGAFGRVYLGGEQRDIDVAQVAATKAIESLTGRESASSRKD